MISRPATAKPASFAKLGLCGFAILACFALPRPAWAHPPADACHRLASDAAVGDALDGVALAAACSAAGTAATQGADAADRNILAGQYDAFAAIAARLANSIPRDPDDAGSVLALTGKDPGRILAWVRDNTRIVPYAGMLRGASGVLTDRAGNSLDRALLLADLLNRAGYTVRIARAQIPPEAAEALRNRFVASAAKASTPLATTLDKATLLRQIGADPRLGPQVLEAVADAALKDMQTTGARAQGLYHRVVPALLSTLGNDPSRDNRLSADAVALLRDHFWVQQQVGSTWNDVDPDNDLVGKPSAIQTFPPSAVPGDLEQRVTIKLSAETLASGKLSETTLLQQSWLPSEVAGKAITLTHTLYPQAPLDANLAGKAIQSGFLDGVKKSSVALPAMAMGGTSTSGQLFSFDGRVEAPTRMNLASLGGNALVSGNSLSAGITSVFGAPAPAPSSTTQSNVVAEWLEIDLEVPGQATETHRRAIFDLIGGNARARNADAAAQFTMTDAARANRALALSGTTDVYIVTSQPSPAALRAQALTQLAALFAGAAKSLRTQTPFAEALPQNPVEPVFLRWLSWRRLASPAVICDRPNVALFWRKIAFAKDGSLVSNAAFDIVSNSVASDLSFDNRVAQGIADTVAERVMLDGAGDSGNTAAAYAADLRSGKAWTVLRSGQSAGRVSMQSATTARIVSALQHGEIVVAPVSEATASNWWRIDTASGNALGIGSGGMGQALAEEAETLHISRTAAFAMKSVGCAVLGVYSAAAEHGFSLRAGVEGAICLAGAGLESGPLSTMPAGEAVGILIGHFLGEGVITVVSTPVEGSEGSGGEGSAASGDAPTTSEPVCRSPDDGCFTATALSSLSNIATRARSDLRSRLAQRASPEGRQIEVANSLVALVLPRIP